MTLSGIGYDETGGHQERPHRSIIRRWGFELGCKRHATKEQAALRILVACRDHQPFAAAGRFPLSQFHAVDREVLDNLVALAREAVEAEASGAPTAAVHRASAPDAAAGVAGGLRGLTSANPAGDEVEHSELEQAAIPAGDEVERSELEQATWLSAQKAHAMVELRRLQLCESANNEQV